MVDVAGEDFGGEAMAGGRSHFGATQVEALGFVSREIDSRHRGSADEHGAASHIA
jgi:hypothetical protein